jgi:hypothetical protein
LKSKEKKYETERMEQALLLPFGTFCLTLDPSSSGEGGQVMNVDFTLKWSHELLKESSALV